MAPVSMVVIGAGARGNVYAGFAAGHSEKARIVGVAEPREYYRTRMAGEHKVPAANVAADWRELAGRPKLADAALICTQDNLHVEPALAFIKQGYHILLEKPMGQKEPDTRRVAEAAQQAGIMLAVCHVLRYTDYTQRLKAIVESGAIGDVVSLQHLEPMGYWHMAHSFVRGNWGNEARSSPLLLSKSCHDLDWIHYVMGGRCERISSFGSLYHFRKEQRPAGAAGRCLDCGVEARCPYSAKKIYLGRLARGETGWPLDTVTPDLTEAGVTKALREGPYGRCVYACDNDVVDNQVVNMLYSGGRTATFTVLAFNKWTDRKTRIFGTRGELLGDGQYIEHFDFLTDKAETIDTRALNADDAYGHGGGDYRLMQAFTAAIASGDRSKIVSGAQETLESHLMVFAAERSRREGRVVTMAY
ncbi:MAG: Gfo/Idh/MocA family oxidoreductase [Planctomycetota bacterium]|nr:Gfo/Idh/MocA family oxidoreductase [Planctomycetota bacterium]